MNIPHNLEQSLSQFDLWLDSPEAMAIVPDADQRQQIREMLRSAALHLQKTRDNPLAEINDHAGDLTGAEGEMALSRLLATRPAMLSGAKDIVGVHQYEDLDPRWLKTIAEVMFSAKVPFPTDPQVIPIADTLSLGLVGDWGTGDASSLHIIAMMAAQNPDLTIHLGDVYYAGTEAEEGANFVTPWRVGKLGSLTLNSNHEMYSGGKGYFNVALASPKFALQKGTSYFALSNSHWLIVGLDSAYHADGAMYDKGELDATQLAFLKNVVTTDLMPDGSRKKLILLSHHEAVTYDGEVTNLGKAVEAELGDGPDFWYWGHLHSAGVLQPVSMGAVQLQGRCVGHGGVPYAPDELVPALLWTESQLAGDPQEPKRALNGFVRISLDGPSLTETFWSEKGESRWSQVHP